MAPEMKVMVDQESGANLLNPNPKDQLMTRDLPRTFKILFTLALYLTFIAFGICRGIYGPTLGELQLITGATLPQISSVFTWLGIGGIAGSLTYGYLFDRFRALPLMIVSQVGWASLTSAIPWCRLLPAMMAVCAGQSFIFTGLAVGCNVVILRLWRSRSSPVLLGLHVLFTLGCVLAPLIAEPFLSKHLGKTGAPSSFLRCADANYTASLTHLPGSEQKSNVSALNEVDLNTAYNGPHDEFGAFNNCSPAIPQSDVYKAYSITAVYILAIAVFECILFVIYNRHQLSSPNEKISNVPLIRNLPRLRYISWTLFLFFTMCFGGVENIYMGFLYTFAHTYVGISTHESAQLAAGTFAAFAVGRLLSLFFTKCLPIRVIITLYLSCAVAGSIALCCLGNQSVIGLWICAIMVYLGIAPLFGSCLLWARDYLPVSGKFTATYVVGYTTGMMTWPILTGYLIDSSGGPWFTYLATGLLGGCLLVVTLLWTIWITMGVKREVTEVTIGDSKLRESGIWTSMRSLQAL